MQKIKRIVRKKRYYSGKFYKRILLLIICSIVALILTTQPTSDMGLVIKPVTKTNNVVVLPETSNIVLTSLFFLGLIGYIWKRSKKKMKSKLKSFFIDRMYIIYIVIYFIVYVVVFSVLKYMNVGATIK